MQALLLTGYGGTDKYKLSMVEKPKPKEGEVLIKISAVALNNTDVNTRLGRYGVEQVKKANTASKSAPASWSGEPLKFPWIQGADGCGYIKEMGPNFDSKDKAKYLNRRVVTNPAICEYDVKRKQSFLKRYVGSELPGTFAQYICVPISQVLMVDNDNFNDNNNNNNNKCKLSDTELCSFLTAYLTAYGMVKDSNLSKGDIFLITGASGGVGCALIQLSLLIGAIPIGIVGSKEKKDFAINKLNCKYVVNRKDGDTIEQLKRLLTKMNENENKNNNKNKNMNDNKDNYSFKMGMRKIDVIADVVGGDNFDGLLKLMARGGVLVTAGAIAGGVININIRTVYLNWLTIIGNTTRTTNDEFKQFFQEFVLNGKLKPIIGETFYGLDSIPRAQEMFMKKQYFGKIVVSLENAYDKNNNSDKRSKM